MPSAALIRWQNDRMARLAETDVHCDALLAAPPPRTLLVEESLQGYVMLLSGHFQGFCRDLYTECAQLCASAVPASMGPAVQQQFNSELRINSANPTVDTLRRDFERFGFVLDLAAADPANPARITHLGHLNFWRNSAAHQKTRPAPSGIPASLALADIRSWRASCDGLARSLDGIMYQRMQLILGVPPW